MKIILEDDDDRLMAATMRTLLEASYGFWMTIEEQTAEGSPARTTAHELRWTSNKFKMLLVQAINQHTIQETL